MVIMRWLVISTLVTSLGYRPEHTFDFTEGSSYENGILDTDKAEVLGSGESSLATVTGGSFAQEDATFKFSVETEKPLKKQMKKALEKLVGLWVRDKPQDLTIDEVLGKCSDSSDRILIAPAFDVTCKNGTVKTMGIKRKSNATMADLNVALEGLPEILDVVMDGSNISGDLKDLKMPSGLSRLQMRGCDVKADLKDLQTYTLTALKLSGRKIHGKLEDLNWEKLEILDLRGAKSVTGDLSTVGLNESSPLRGLWLQNTSVTGDIVELLKRHPKLEYVNLGHTKIFGEIRDEWKGKEGIGKGVRELMLQHSMVKFNMSPPEDKADLPFPNLTKLDVSGNPLDMEAWKFIYPFAKKNYYLYEVAASECGLFGPFKGIHTAQNYPLMWQVRTLDLSKNNITALEGGPRSIHLDVSNNRNLKDIAKSYFGGTKVLDLRNTGFNGTAVIMKANGSVQAVEKPTLREVSTTNGTWTCKEVRPLKPSAEKSIVLITPEDFAPKELCTCVDGFAGVGTSCIKCTSGFEPLPPNKECCGCPEGKARVDFDRSANSSDSACLRCYGKGCAVSSCQHDSCRTGYRGVLCGSCVQGYQQRISRNSDSYDECQECEETVRWWPWIVAVTYGLGLAAAMGFLIFFTKPEEKDAESDRKEEFKEQSLLLLSVIQILKTAQSTMEELLDSPVQLKLGDLLYSISVQCGFLGYEKGRILEALSSAFCLPLLCTVGLLAAFCRGSPFWALKFCIFVTSMLFVGTIQATVSNFICTSNDKDDIPLLEASYLKEFPFAACEGSGPLHISLYVALVVNAGVIPGSLLVLALYVSNETAKVRGLFRQLQPSCTCGLTGDGVKMDFRVPQRDGKESEKDESLLIYMASYSIYASQVVGCQSMEVKRIDHGLSVTLKASEGSNFVNLSSLQKYSMLSDAECHAMWLGDVLVNRQSAKIALKERPSLWLGVKSSFFRYGAMDPLLCEGFSKVLVFILTTLCAKRSTAPLAGLMLLAGGLGVFRGMPLGSRGRNQLAAASLTTLGLFTCALSMLGTVLGASFALKWIVPIVAVAVPSLFFMHLQLLPGDETLQASQLLESAQHFLKTTPAHETKTQSLQLPTGAWAFESDFPWLGRALAKYRALWS